MFLTESFDLQVRISLLCRGKHCQCGMRTFAAATLWNSLNVRDRGNRVRGSPSLESFKGNLKTLLFKEHFYPFSS